MSKKIRFALALLILAFSLGMLLWASLPVFVERRVIPIPSDDLQLPTPSAWIVGREV